MDALKKFLENKDWKYFELFISEIFERFGYKVRRNVKIRYMKYKEFDLIAKKGNKMLLIECKKWKRKYSKFRNIKKEIQKFMEKVKDYKKYTFFENIFGIMIFLNVSFAPIKIEKEKIFVISLDYLNSFLNELENLYF